MQRGMTHICLNLLFVPLVSFFLQVHLIVMLVETLDRSCLLAAFFVLGTSSCRWFKNIKTPLSRLVGGLAGSLW